jgi:hypothetical protein
MCDLPHYVVDRILIRLVTVVNLPDIDARNSAADAASLG